MSTSVTLTVPDPPTPPATFPVYGSWADCSSLGPNPLAQIVQAALAADQVRLETSPTNTDSTARAKVDQVTQMGGADTSPKTIGSPIAYVRAVRLGGPTTGLTVAVTATNSGVPPAPPPAGAWLVGAQTPDPGPGTYALGTTGANENIHIEAAGGGSSISTTAAANADVTATAGHANRTAGTTITDTAGGSMARNAGGSIVDTATAAWSASGATADLDATGNVTLDAGASLAEIAAVNCTRTAGAAIQDNATTTVSCTAGTGYTVSATTGNITERAHAGSIQREANVDINDSADTGAVVVTGHTAVSLGTQAGPITVQAVGGNVVLAGPHVSISATPTVPDASAILDVVSSTLGLGLPQVQRATLLGIATPKPGLLAFDTTNSILTANTGSSVSPSFTRVSGGPNVFAVNTSGQSIPNNAATGVANWTAITNVGGDFVPSTGIFTAPVAGFYPGGGALQFSAAASAVGNEFHAALEQNGTIQAQGMAIAQTTTAVKQAVQTPPVAGLQLAAGDTLVLQAFQNGNGGAALALTNVGSFNTFSIALLN